MRLCAPRGRAAKRALSTLGTVLVAGLAAGPATASAASPVDALISTCPSAAEVAAIDADFTLTFDADPTAGTLVCTAASGSADLTRLRERAYQALRVMKAMSFSRPLPWTTLGLYDWLKSAIHGIRFRGDIAVSFCCDPPGVIDVQTQNLASLQTTDWVNPGSGTGLAGTVALLVHEARHNQIGGHTCADGNDATLTEMGAWATQFWLGQWEAFYSGDFLGAPDRAPGPGYYRGSGRGDADRTADVRICAPPVADLSLTAQAPATVQPGAELSYSVAVANAGPADAPDTFVSDDPPRGLSFLRARVSQGSCGGPSPGQGGPVVCTLGTLASGGAATATLVYRVTAPGGSTISRRLTSDDPQISAAAKDPNRANNSAGSTTRVTGPGTSKDTRKPRVTLGSVPKQLSLRSFLKGVTVKAKPDERASFNISLVGARKVGRLTRYDVVLALAKTFVSTRATTVRLKPKKSKLSTARPFTVLLKVVAHDLANNITTVTRKVKITLK